MFLGGNDPLGRPAERKPLLTNSSTRGMAPFTHGAEASYCPIRAARPATEGVWAPTSNLTGPPCPPAPRQTPCDRQETAQTHPVTARTDRRLPRSDRLGRSIHNPVAETLVFQPL